MIKIGLENIVRKRENADKQHFLFPQFSTHLNNVRQLSHMLLLPSNALQLDLSKFWVEK